MVGIIECRGNWRVGRREARGALDSASRFQTVELGWCQDDYIILKKNILGSGYNGKAWRLKKCCRTPPVLRWCLEMSHEAHNIISSEVLVKVDLWVKVFLKRRTLDMLFLVFRKKLNDHQQIVAFFLEDKLNELKSPGTFLVAMLKTWWCQFETMGWYGPVYTGQSRYERPYGFIYHHIFV